ncbi:MAG: sulfurtransferase [Bdellovibrionota bacterium]
MRLLSSPLVSASALFENLRYPSLRICDVRWYLSKEKRGIDEYRRGHLPGAVFVDLDQDLCGPLSRKSGRHPWPSPLLAAERLSRLGISSDTFVACYDDASGSVAGRLWFLLKWLGHDRATVLDGGITRWKALHYPVTANPTPIPPPGKLLPNPRPFLVVDKEEALAASLGEKNGTLLDAREGRRYRGEFEPVDTRAGHIPGALSFPFAENMNERTKEFLPPEDLQRRFEIIQDKKVIAYCGSGVTACHNLLALETAGIPARLYAGSWSEWARDERLKAETGDRT